MATNDSGVYRVTEIIGTSNVSWEDAAKTAVVRQTASLVSPVGEPSICEKSIAPLILSS